MILHRASQTDDLRVNENQNTLDGNHVTASCLEASVLTTAPSLHPTSIIELV